jgi:Reverse transcriptase (RNA-dependent DNA polymerase)
LIPRTWRQGDLVSLFKAGDPTKCNNYRGITLLPVIDKLYYSILAKRILEHVQLHDHQYEFVREKGTAEALFNLVTTMENHQFLDKSLQISLLDVQKALINQSRHDDDKTTQSIET